jgi:hypothetical protein
MIEWFSSSFSLIHFKHFGRRLILTVNLAEPEILAGEEG